MAAPDVTTTVESKSTSSFKTIDSTCKLYLANLTDIIQAANQFIIIPCRDGDIKMVLDQHTSRFTRFVTVVGSEDHKSIIKPFIDIDAVDIHHFLHHLKYGYSIDGQVYKFLSHEFQLDIEKQSLVNTFIDVWTSWIVRNLPSDNDPVHYSIVNTVFQLIPLSRLLSSLISSLRYQMITKPIGQSGNLMTINLRYIKDNEFNCAMQNLGPIKDPDTLAITLSIDDHTMNPVMLTTLLSEHGHQIYVNSHHFFGVLIII